MSPKNLLFIMSCCFVFACTNDETTEPDDETEIPETSEDDTTVEAYNSCSIPDTKAHKVACSPAGASKTATCAVDYVFDCDSLICSVYNSSDPFCTYRCVPSSKECNSDIELLCSCPEGKECKTKCPRGGHCIEFIKGTSAYYCLPDDIYKEKGE